MSAFAGERARAQLLADGRRLHLQHGPIDLVIEACGPARATNAAYKRAVQAFDTVLTELVEELALLRAPLDPGHNGPDGEVAKRMWAAAKRFGHGCFLTPMIAVAGAVADHMLDVVAADPRIVRAYINNGGDIAIRLGAGQVYSIGICSHPVTGKIDSTTEISSEDGIGGIATSGWRGRSHSLGIADAVTVLADTAANADAAATLIANAVDLPGSNRIRRQPSRELAPDSDLGERLVTIGVEPLTRNEIEDALNSGEELAQSIAGSGIIHSVYLALQGGTRTVGAKGASSSCLPGRLMAGMIIPETANV